MFMTAEAVGQEVKRRLLKLTIAQGAETDIGRVVHLGHKSVSDDMIPFTTVIEGNEFVDEVKGTLTSTAQQYVLFAYLPCDALNPNTAAHAAIRDMKRAIFRDDDGQPSKYLSPPKGNAIRYMGKDIAPRADGQSFVLASINFGVAMVEDLANP